MPLRQILGLVGSLILFIGVFTPIISLPIVGSMNYFQNGRGDGVIILVLAVFSVFLTLTKRYRFLLFTGGGSLAILAFTFINFQYRMSQMQSQMKESMANNPFGGLGEAMLNTVQIQWGWAVLIIGAALLIAAALLKPTPSEIESEQTDETLTFGGIGGGASSISDSVLYGVLGVIALGWIGLIAYSFIAAPSTPNALSNSSSNKGLPFPNQRTSSSTSTDTSSTSPEETAYVSNVAISKVEVGKTILDEAGVFGELKNNGDKTLDEVEITIYFLDKQGNPVSEKTYTPVNASAQNFGMSDTSALKPKYSRKFGYKADDAPSDWSKKVNVQVTKVQFAK